jgi:hypothetical protein
MKTSPTNLDGVRVGGALGSVDELVSEALGDRLDVAEGGFTGLRKRRISAGGKDMIRAPILTPTVRRATAWLTRRRGETSTAWRRTVPWEPIRVESSRGPVLTMASTKT